MSQLPYRLAPFFIFSHPNIFSTLDIQFKTHLKTNHGKSAINRGAIKQILCGTFFPFKSLQHTELSFEMGLKEKAC